MTSKNTSSRVVVRRVRELTWMFCLSSDTATFPIISEPLPVTMVSSVSLSSALSTPVMFVIDSRLVSFIPSTEARMISFPTFFLSSSGVPSTTSFPWLMIPILSASWSASSRYCVVRKMVMPRSLLSFWTSSQIDLRLTGSSPVVGSSRKRIWGLWIIEAARSTRRFIPPE